MKKTMKDSKSPRDLSSRVAKDRYRRASSESPVTAPCCSAQDRAAWDQVTYGQDPSNRPSTLQDLERGKKTEVELFAGAMVELGKKHGIPTPYSEVMLHGIHVQEEKNAGTIPGL